MQLNILNQKDSAKMVDVADGVFQVEFNEALIHQVVTAYMAGGRAGTKAQKTRAEVSGGGKKPWKQKGTGRARVGSIRSPLWRGGGKTFAAVPRSFAQKVNKKMYHGAMRSILSELIRQSRLLAVDGVTLDTPKTKVLLAKMQEWGVSKALILVDHIDESLYLAARNLPHVEVISVQEMNPVDLIGYEHVVVTIPALRMIEERLA